MADGVSSFELEEAHVAPAHGDAFGAPGHLRLSCAAPPEVLRRAVERIGHAPARPVRAAGE